MGQDDEVMLLGARLDGLARCFMALVADLEKREQLNGPRFCGSLRRMAGVRKKAAGQESVGVAICEIAELLDEARKTRRRLSDAG